MKSAIIFVIIFKLNRLKQSSKYINKINKQINIDNNNSKVQGTGCARYWVSKKSMV